MIVPIKSTWPTPIGKRLTDRAIHNRAKQGWYGEVEKLKALAKSNDKAISKPAKKRLKELEGQEPRQPVVKRPKMQKPKVDLSEFI
jgi:hypothetical protein